MSLQAINNRRYMQNECKQALRTGVLLKKFSDFTIHNNKLVNNGLELVCFEKKLEVLEKELLEGKYESANQFIRYIHSKYCGLSRNFIGQFFNSYNAPEPEYDSEESCEEDSEEDSEEEDNDEPIYMKLEPIILKIGRQVMFNGKLHRVTRVHKGLHSIVECASNKPVRGKRFNGSELSF